MLPNTKNINELVTNLVKAEKNKTKTFGLNVNKNIIGGMVDDLAALHQSVYLMLNIEADKYIIYPYIYGLTTIDLIGKPSYYVMAVLPGRIKQTLLSDDRVTSVSDFKFKVDGKRLHVDFIVHSIYGDIPEETVVKI